MPVIKTDFTKLFRQSRGGAKLDHNLALKELRKIDPDFLKRTVRASNQNLSKGQKDVIRRKINSTIQELRSNNQSDLYRPTKRKGETKSQYNKRLQELKEAYGQGDNKSKGIYMQNPDKNLKTKYRLKGNKIIQTVGGEDDEPAISLFIQPSRIPPDEETLFEDISDAIDESLEADFQNFDSVQITVSVLGKRARSDKSTRALSIFLDKDDEGNAIPVLKSDTNFLIEDYVNDLFTSLFIEGESGTLETYGGLIVEGN